MLYLLTPNLSRWRVNGRKSPRVFGAAVGDSDRRPGLPGNIPFVPGTARRSPAIGPKILVISRQTLVRPIDYSMRTGFGRKR